MKPVVQYLGHASLKFITSDGKVIYVDPYAGEDYSEPADLILVTHQHFDHNSISLPAKKPETVILQNFDLLKNGKHLEKDLGSIRIEAVEAGNKNHSIDECVGYLIYFDDLCIYVAGDTGPTEQMKSLSDRNIDVAFLPVDGVYTMSPEKAMECADLIQAKKVVPYHTKVGELYDSNQAHKFNLENAWYLEAGQKGEL